MVIKKIWAMYFSATGTTAKVCDTIADELAAKFGAERETFDFTLPGARGGDDPGSNDPAIGASDLVVFGTPVIAGRVPNVLLKYLDHISGGGAAAVPVVCYGNRNYDDALIELRDILEKGGYHTVAGAAFIGEHSFSNILAAGRPDEQDLATALEFADGIAKKLEADKDGKCLEAPVEVSGESPLRSYYTPRDRAGAPVNILKVKPKTDMEKCLKCMTCVRVCPLGSIDPEDVSAITGICMKCCACVKKCPAGAKYFDDPKYLYHKEELELGYARRAEPEFFL